MRQDENLKEIIYKPTNILDIKLEGTTSARFTVSFWNRRAPLILTKLNKQRQVIIKQNAKNEMEQNSGQLHTQFS